MALFSRGKRNSEHPVDADVEAAADRSRVAEPVVHEAPAEPAATAAEPAPAAPSEDAASVGISVSAFRGVGAPQPAAQPPAEPAGEKPIAQQQRGNQTAPPVTETLPGIRDNVLLAEALGRLDAAPTPPQILDVARQLMQGRLILRVKGDARTLLAEGATPPLAVAKLGDETFVVAYSGGLALRASIRADGDGETSAMGQSAVGIIRSVLSGPHAGIVLDPASAPASAVIKREMLEKMLEDIDPDSTIKNLLSAERTPATAPAIVDALSRVPMWVAVSRIGDTGQFGIAEARTAEGERFVEIFSHPLEVVVLGRGDRPAPMTGEQLSKALRSDASITGIIIDPAGPWITLTRDDLSTLIAG